MTKTFKLFDIDTATPPTTPEQPALQQKYEHDISSTKDAKTRYNPIARQKEAEEQQKEVYKSHQEAMHKAGQCKADINIGILSAESPLILLLKAIECISLMTGDKLFLEQSQANLWAIYGAGLLEPVELELELAKIQKQLQMLQRPELDSEPADNRERIQQAIKWHRQREAHLLELLER